MTSGSFKSILFILMMLAIAAFVAVAVLLSLPADPRVEHIRAMKREMQTVLP